MCIRDRGGSAVSFTAGATNLSDVDSTTYDKLTLSFTQSNFADGANEQLVFNGASSGGTISHLAALTSSSSGSIVIGATTYAYTTAVSGGIATLTFTGASNAELTQSQAEALLDAMRYQNTSENPTTGSSRVFSLRPTDGSALDGNTATFTVTVAAVNDAPLSLIHI